MIQEMGRSSVTVGRSTLDITRSLLKVHRMNQYHQNVLATQNSVLDQKGRTMKEKLDDKIREITRDLDKIQHICNSNCVRNCDENEGEPDRTVPTCPSARQRSRPIVNINGANYVSPLVRRARLLLDGRARMSKSASSTRSTSTTRNHTPVLRSKSSLLHRDVASNGKLSRYTGTPDSVTPKRSVIERDDDSSVYQLPDINTMHTHGSLNYSYSDTINRTSPAPEFNKQDFPQKNRTKSSSDTPHTIKIVKHPKQVNTFFVKTKEIAVKTVDTDRRFPRSGKYDGVGSEHLPAITVTKSSNTSNAVNTMDKHDEMSIDVIHTPKRTKNQRNDKKDKQLTVVLQPRRASDVSKRDMLSPRQGKDKRSPSTGEANPTDGNTSPGSSPFWERHNPFESTRFNKTRRQSRHITNQLVAMFDTIERSTSEVMELNELRKRAGLNVQSLPTQATSTDENAMVAVWLIDACSFV